MREHPLEIHDRDPLADPVRVHHARRVGPHLEVVRHHEVLGDPFAEDAVDQLARSSRIGLAPVRLLRPHRPRGRTRRRPRGGRSLMLFWNGYGKKPVHHPDPRLAHAAPGIRRPMQPVEELVEVAEVGEQHVAADVVGEPVAARLDRRRDRPTWSLASRTTKSSWPSSCKRYAAPSPVGPAPMMTIFPG